MDPLFWRPHACLGRDIAMNTSQPKRHGWTPYVLASGFVLLASGAVLPHATTTFAVVIREVRALFA